MLAYLRKPSPNRCALHQKHKEISNWITAAWAAFAFFEYRTFLNETQPSEIVLTDFVFFTVSPLLRFQEFTNTHPATDPQRTSNPPPLKGFSGGGGTERVLIIAEKRIRKHNSNCELWGLWAAGGMLVGSGMSLRWYFCCVLRARFLNLQFSKTFFFLTRRSQVKCVSTDFVFSRFWYITLNKQSALWADGGGRTSSDEAKTMWKLCGLLGAKQALTRQRLCVGS